MQSVANLDENASSLFGVPEINVSFNNSRRQNMTAFVSKVSGCTVDASGPSTLRGKVLSHDKSTFSRITVINFSFIHITVFACIPTNCRSYITDVDYVPWS